MSAIFCLLGPFLVNSKAVLSILYSKEDGHEKVNHTFMKNWNLTLVNSFKATQKVASPWSTTNCISFHLSWSILCHVNQSDCQIDIGQKIVGCRNWWYNFFWFRENRSNTKYDANNVHSLLKTLRHLFLHANFVLMQSDFELFPCLFVLDMPVNTLPVTHLLNWSSMYAVS